MPVGKPSSVRGRGKGKGERGKGKKNIPGVI